MKHTLFVLLAFASQLHAQTPQKLKLWYNKPAQYFEEALVLGNGKQGATVFGGTKSYQIYLNDLTLCPASP